MRKAIAASILGLTALGGASPDVPPSVLARLPTYCRYDVDVRGQANPYAAFARDVDEDGTVCPFAAGVAQTAQVYRVRGDAACAASDLPSAKIGAVSEIDGAEARRAMDCSLARVKHPKPGATTRSYLVRYRDPGGALLGVINAGRYTRVAARDGLPFTDMAIATVDDQVYECFAMLDGAASDPAAYFKLVSLPLPAGATQEEIAGRDCRDVAKERYGVEFGIDAVSAEFSLWLDPSPQTPQAEQFDDVLTSALAAAGVTPRVAGTRIFSPGTARADRAADGTGFVMLGGKRKAMIEMRRMTQATCAAIFSAAATLKLHLQTSQTDLMILNPPGIDGRPPRTHAKTVAVTSAADLCDVLRRGFDEWHAAATEMPSDMSDLDGQNSSLGD